MCLFFADIGKFTLSMKIPTQGGATKYQPPKASWPTVSKAHPAQKTPGILAFPRVPRPLNHGIFILYSENPAPLGGGGVESKARMTAMAPSTDSNCGGS